ncbi:hypothetical protein NFI96_010054 [Prochilodus magdalenae]|nr:hypothetical protein NFI96_010054 [Prochilodus magdalenae]
MASKAPRVSRKDVSGKSDSPAAHGDEVTASMLTSLLEDHRNAICAAMETRFDQLQSTLTDLSHRTTTLESGLDVASDRIQALEDQCASLKETCAKLQAKTTDLESRSRRNNIRIIGLPEEIEGQRPTTFFAGLLFEVFGDAFPSPPEVDRVHRALSAKPQTGGKPRAVIIRLHHFQNKERIIREARARRGKLLFRGKPISIFEDYAPDVLEQRSTSLDFLDQIQFPRVNMDLYEMMGAPISTAEVMEAIKSLKGGKSPGPDGFSAEFYKEFSSVLAPILSYPALACAVLQPCRRRI